MGTGTNSGSLYWLNDMPMIEGITRMVSGGMLVCPGCNSQLVYNKNLHCQTCKQVFPFLDQIPILLDNPEKHIDHWRQQFLNFIQVQQQSIAHEKRIIDSPLTYKPFRKRLENRVRARHENMQAVGDLMAPLRDLEPGIPSKVGNNSAFDFTNLLYLMRDWGWDTAEPEMMCDKIVDILPDDLSLNSLLVLGAGGCKESYILHEHYNCPLTVSVDIDPFKLMGASTVISGGELNLYQILTNNVRDESDHISYWELHAPSVPESEFHYMLADAGRLPFPDNSFQLVFTPFLIDAIGEDFRSFAAKVMRIVKPGGYWVNYGAMNFRPEVAYTGEEVLSILADTGLKILTHGYASKPHIAPSESCLQQVFDCLYFLAMKDTNS